MYKENTFFEYFDTYRDRYRNYENRTLEELLSEILEYAKNMSSGEIHMIQSAFDLGKKAHE